jgi:UDP-glucose 4-epimerase
MRGAIAITGLKTFVGRRLAERLASAKPARRIVGLDLHRPQGLTQAARFHRADLTEPTADARLAEIFEKEKVEAVVHAAFRRDPEPDLETDHELETIGTLHVMHACAAAKVQRLVVASSTMLYGPHGDNPNFLTEDHPLRGHPDAHNVENRREAEKLLGEWSRGHPDTQVSVLRTCWIMGPTYSDHVTRYFARPVVPTLIGYDPLLQFIHEDDALRVFEKAALEPHPGVFNVVARGVLPLSTLLRLAGKRALPLPSPILYRLRDVPSQGQTGDRPSGFYDYLRYLWVADGQRAWSTFGEPRYTTREAWISFVSARRMRRYR